MGDRSGFGHGLLTCHFDRSGIGLIPGFSLTCHFDRSNLQEALFCLLDLLGRHAHAQVPDHRTELRRDDLAVCVPRGHGLVAPGDDAPFLQPRQLPAHRRIGDVQLIRQGPHARPRIAPVDACPVGQADQDQPCRGIAPDRSLPQRPGSSLPAHLPSSSAIPRPSRRLR